MLISVIIPCYNCEKFLKETLQSVLEQSYPNIEIICVDNGSTDNTVSLIESYINKYSNVKLLFEPQKGANRARNTGLRNSKGDFVQFLDSDDLIHKDKLKIQSKKLLEGFDLVVSDRIVYDENMLQKIEEHTFSTISDHLLETCISKILITGNPLYNKKTLIEAGAWNEDLTSAQDWELHIRLALRGKKFGYVSGFFLYCRRHQASLSSNWKKVNLNAIKVLGWYQSEIMKSPAFENKNLQRKIFYVYFLGAIHTKKVMYYSKMIESWNLNRNYREFLNISNRLLAFLFGLKGLIRIRSWFNRGI